MLLSKYLTKIDLFGTNVGFFHNDFQGVFRNLFGGMISLLVILLGFGGSIYFFLEFVNRENSTINKKRVSN